jgi:hypothetical protein
VGVNKSVLFVQVHGPQDFEYFPIAEHVGILIWGFWVLPLGAVPWSPTCHGDMPSGSLFCGCWQVVVIRHVSMWWGGTRKVGRLDNVTGYA